MKRDHRAFDSKLVALLERGRVIPPARDAVRARALARARATVTVAATAPAHRSLDGWPRHASG